MFNQVGHTNLLIRDLKREVFGPVLQVVRLRRARLSRAG